MNTVPSLVFLKSSTPEFQLGVFLPRARTLSEAHWLEFSVHRISNVSA